MKYLPKETNMPCDEAFSNSKTLHTSSLLPNILTVLFLSSLKNSIHIVKLWFYSLLKCIYLIWLPSIAVLRFENLSQHQKAET